MATVLFGWELGGGFGHVRPMLPLAIELAARGHTPVFALRNVAEAWTAVRDCGFAVVQAPFRSGTVRGAGGRLPARTYSDVLAMANWDVPDELEGVTRGWEELFRLLKPALAVVDSAPTLLLAARGLLPVVQTGAGFGVPPSHLPAFPVLGETATAITRDDAILASIHEVQRRRGRPAPPCVPAVFEGPAFATGFAELDPYRDHRASPGPMEPVPSPMPLPAAPRWFAYLAAESPDCVPALEALARSGVPGEAFVRGWTQEHRNRARESGLAVADRTVSYDDVFRRASVVVHHAGTGTAGTALAAGRPQLLFPHWPEQTIPAKRLVELGVALAPAAEECGAALKRLLEERAFAGAAAAAAERIRAGGPWNAVGRVADACSGILR